MAERATPARVTELAREAHLDDGSLFRATAEMLAKLGGAASSEMAIEDALEAVVDVLGADRGALLHSGDVNDVVAHARGPAGVLPQAEWSEISLSLVERARRDGPQLWDAFDDGGPASVMDLGIIAAAAVPVQFVSGDAVGVLYVDVREPGKCLAEDHLRFLTVISALLAPFVQSDLARDQAERRAACAEARAEAANAPPLFELLSPPSMAEVAEAAEIALSGTMNVLIRGDSGTGKTALATALARAAGDGPIVRATLGTSDDLNTIASELFGHERGAYSGAHARRRALVAHADGGTLILDEVLNLPLRAQQLLLDFTQFGTYRPLGYDGAVPKKAAVRIIAATQGDLDAAVDEGRFRRDLYYRLSGVVLALPPLSARRDEIPFLAESLLRRQDASRAWGLSVGVRRALRQAPLAWEGNMRELDALLGRARMRALRRDAAAENVIIDDLRGEIPAAVAPSEPPAPIDLGDDVEARWQQLLERRAVLDADERELLRAALHAEDGVVSRVARRLSMPRTTLAHRLRVLDVDA